MMKLRHKKPFHMTAECSDEHETLMVYILQLSLADFFFFSFLKLVQSTHPHYSNQLMKPHIETPVT